MLELYPQILSFFKVSFGFVVLCKYDKSKQSGPLMTELYAQCSIISPLELDCCQYSSCKLVLHFCQ